MVALWFLNLDLTYQKTGVWCQLDDCFTFNFVVVICSEYC